MKVTFEGDVHYLMGEMRRFIEERKPLPEPSPTTEPEVETETQSLDEEPNLSVTT